MQLGGGATGLPRSGGIDAATGGALRRCLCIRTILHTVLAALLPARRSHLGTHGSSPKSDRPLLRYQERGSDRRARALSRAELMARGRARRRGARRCSGTWRSGGFQSPAARAHPSDGLLHPVEPLEQMFALCMVSTFLLCSARNPASGICGVLGRCCPAPTYSPKDGSRCPRVWCTLRLARSARGNRAHPRQPHTPGTGRRVACRRSRSAPRRSPDQRREPWDVRRGISRGR